MPKIRLRGIRTKGHRSRSDFALGIVVTEDGVFFDKLWCNEKNEEKHQIIIASTHKGARLLAHWILEHVPE